MPAHRYHIYDELRIELVSTAPRKVDAMAHAWGYAAKRGCLMRVYDGQAKTGSPQEWLVNGEGKAVVASRRTV